MGDGLDLFFNKTPEAKEAQRKHNEMLKRERQRKIERAVRSENLEIFIREYGKNEEKKRQMIALFLDTKEGIKGGSDTIGRMEFTLHENARLEEVFVAAKYRGRKISGHAKKLLHINTVGMYPDYRGYGLSEKLIAYFFDLYRKQYQDFPISVEFMNPIAEYTVQKVLKEKGMKHVLDERLIQRYYLSTDETDDIALINTLKEKDQDLFPLESVAYIS